MRRIKRIVITGVFVSIFGLLMSQPGIAQSCTGNQDDAVDCFIRNAVSTRLLVIPKGMTMTQFKSYGVAISKVLQSPPAAVFLLGMAGAIADAIPPSNLDGTVNQAAQDAFVNAIITAGLRDGIINLPVETTSAQLEQFARELTAGMTSNGGVSISPGAFLRVLDVYIVAATPLSGPVNWSQVTTNINILVSGLQTAGLIRLPASVTLSSIEQFALDTANAIEVYKLATGKAHL
jgi:hypothetical protein